MELKYGCHIPILTYNSVISALLLKWKNKIKSTINDDKIHMHKI